MTLPVPWRIPCEEKNRPMRAVADDADASPHIDRVCEAIAAFGKEDYALARGLLHVVDRGLQRGGVIGFPVRVRAKAARPKVHRVWVLGTFGVDRLRDEVFNA